MECAGCGKKFREEELRDIPFFVVFSMRDYLSWITTGTLIFNQRSQTEMQLNN